MGEKTSMKKKRSKEKVSAVDDGESVSKSKVKKKDVKRKRRDESSIRENEQSEKKNKTDFQDEVYEVPSVDEDSTKGMKKWIKQYHESRPGLKELQQRIDDFIIAHEEKLEQERKEKEARLTEGGWTLVEHHKGRKKTTESETGTTVGSVSKAALEEKFNKKKGKEVSDFYRFQKREAQRNELMMLQSKFEQDKKRIQQLRAARKFRPY